MVATFHAKGVGSQTSGAASFSITCTISAGDAVVVFGSWAQASTTTPTVATTGGAGSDAFTLVYGPFTNGSFKYGGWLLSSAGTGRTGATVSWASSNPSFADGGCESFSGLASTTIDQVAAANGSTSAVTSGNTPTLTSADEFAVAFAASDATITAAGAPWTDDGIIAATSSWIEHQVLTANTAIQSTFTATAGFNWISFALTFKAGAAATVYTDDPTERRQLPLRPPVALKAPFLAFPVPAKEDTAKYEWTLLWQDPVRFKRGLPVHEHPFLAFVKAAPFPEQVDEDSWHQPWRDPVRRITWHTQEQSFLVMTQQSIAPPTGTGTILWYSPWSSIMTRTIMIGEG